MLIKVLLITEKTCIQFEYLPVKNFLKNVVAYFHIIEYYNKKCCKCVYVCLCMYVLHELLVLGKELVMITRVCPIYLTISYIPILGYILYTL